MDIVAGLCGTVLILVVLWEGFETVILPRRVTRRFRLTRLFYRSTWLPWARVVSSWVPGRQETWLSIFGPASFLLLLSIWAGGLILGFAMLQWALGSAVLAQDGSPGFLTDLYLSGTTFFTLGIGDAVPRTSAGRFLVVLESGLGFAFLAIVISYLPALGQAFSRREVAISLLDARAGSPPTASEMLTRHGREGGMEALQQLLQAWELWSAELLEGHLSYPVIAYFRSQHDNQSWLGALTAILDTSALVMAAGVEGACQRQAELTFSMARHALVDLSLVFRTGPREAKHDRLPPEQLTELRGRLAGAGIALRHEELGPRLTELRRLYEPYVHALASYFRLWIPPWIAEDGWVDNWQASSWERRARERKAASKARGEHF